MKKHSSGADCGFFSSTTAAAVALLIVLDLWLVLAHPLANVTTASLDRGEIASAVRVYRQQEVAPDLVLLGSSLVTAPIMQGEASFHQEPIARMIHRRSHLLEAALSERLGRKPQVFCLAAGGEMASDAYLITKNVLVRSRLPSAIIYGIAPRDFQDNLMPGIQSSEAFQVLSSLADLMPVFRFSEQSWAGKTDLVLGRLWALFRFRSDIKVYLTLRIKKLMERALPYVVFEKYGSTLELKAQRRGQFPEEAKGTPTTWPGLAMEHNDPERERCEYIRRYNPVCSSLVESEFSYFEHLLELCRQRGVPLLVVNMPLSRLNKSLLPDQFYRDYLIRVAALCRKHGAELADLNQSRWDQEANFVDSVHLTPEAGLRFLRALADLVARSPVSVRLRDSRGALASGDNRSGQ